MAPNVLRDYIVDKGFSEDIAQEVILRYLKAKHPIRYPKAWAWKTCVRLKGKWFRRDTALTHEFDLVRFRASDSDSDPLKRAINRQELSKVIEAGTPDSSRPLPWGWNRCREDYESLLKLA